MKKCLIIFFTVYSITSYFTISLHGEFNPWDSNVDTGDSLYNMHDESDKQSPVMNGAQGGAFFLIRFFQIVISPQDGPNCRHIPTCSTYGKHAVMKHGAFLGSVMAGERLLRCNPFYPPERDPVPDRVFGR